MPASYHTNKATRTAALYELTPGRGIMRDGVPILYVGLVESAAGYAINPAEADTLAHAIVAALNRGEK